MEQIAGLSYKTDAEGRKRKVIIDLNRYGDNEALEDFLDGLDALSTINEPTTPWEKIKKRMDKKHGIENSI